MTYLLGGVLPDRRPVSGESTNWIVDSIREISQQEYTDIVEARTQLHHFQREVSLYNIFMSAYSELNSFRDFAEERLRQQDSSFDMFGTIEGMDARLMALLSYYKTFLEYWKEKFSVANSTYYNSITQSLLGNNLAYRICYYLRNYAQHFGSPLVNCIIKSNPQAVEVYFSISKHHVLRARLRGWATKQADLQSQPDEIRLTPYLEELKNCVKQMQLQFIRHDFAKVLTHYGLLNQLYTEAKTALPKSYPWILSLDNNGAPRQMIDIPLDHMESVRTVQALLNTP